MAQTTVMNLNNVAVVAANNNTQATVNVVAKEAMNMTKADLRKALEEKGITMSNAEFKATKKAELEARLAAAVAVETKKQAKMPVNPLDDPAVMGMDDEKYLIAPTVTTPVALVAKVTATPKAATKKAYKDMTIAEKKEDALLAKWDVLVGKLAAEYCMQSLKKEYAEEAAGKSMGETWRLFYKNTKGKVSKDEYLVKTKKLFAATARTIAYVYKIDKKTISDDMIKQAINTMCIRGHINFTVVKGEKNENNITFSASKDQMNAMFALAKKSQQ